MIGRSLTIAGSDNSGGAGIQADLKAFAACGVYAQSVIVAVVNENTIGVYGTHPVPSEFVKQQIDGCLDDIGTDSIKIGMLFSKEIVHAVVTQLKKHNIDRTSSIVLDPVMISTSGHRLLQEDAIEVLKVELIPMARIITPNLYEAEILLGEKISADTIVNAAQALSAAFQDVSVLLKGGHLDSGDEVIDVLYNAENKTISRYKYPWSKSKNTHGTGCSLSSSIAAYLARKMTLDSAVQAAENYIHEAIQGAAEWKVGAGNGPINHFCRKTIWPPDQ